MRAENIESVLWEMPLVGPLTAASLRRLAATLAAAAAVVTVAAWRRAASRA